MIYLDNAATTRMSEDVFEAMKPYFCEQYANPSAIYSFAGGAARAVDAARRTIAASIGAEPGEIYFTAGGSESDNWAVKAAAQSCQNKGKHIITSTIEHHAVLHTCQALEKQGYEVTYVNVDECGVIKLDELAAAIRPDTVLITVMTANNEIGTIQPIAEIGALARKNGILFHTDAVQAYGHIPLDVDACNIDMLSASGHKFHGPKGVGFLYIRKGVRVGAFVHGGAQERARRAGTLNTPGIVGMGTAAARAVDGLAARMEKETALRDYLIQKVLEKVPYSRLNGHAADRLPNNANFCFRFIEGESLLILLDQEGICASSGSACTSG
ncbi:MAG: aminotransferase class V-fold PLP-dependent enzyme, partial [Lachnospiraceae bacterium]|nr:aminotransferase class V-fold PLP-dependent enzyme [Lachnospiraceae bacterium]